MSLQDKTWDDANLPKSFFTSVALHGPKPFLFDKTDGQWVGKSWDEIADKVRRVANFLLEKDITVGDRVVICSENRSQWAICDLAVMSIGAIVVPAYTTNTEDDHRYILEHSGAKFIFASGGLVASRLLLAASKNSAIKEMVVFDNDKSLSGDTSTKVSYFDSILQDCKPCNDLAARIDAQSADDTCCFIYTSGTGGRPKAVMLTHRSIQSNVDAAAELLDEGQAKEGARFLSLLPLSHSYEHTAGMHLPFQMGSEVWYCESPDQIALNLTEVQPTLMTAVPRLYEVLHDRITRGVKAKGGFSETLFFKAAELGAKRAKGQKLGLIETVQDAILDKLVRRKVRARLGGRLKFFVSGGAALNPDIGFFFLGLGINILQGYGQTEASPLISANRPGKIRIDTVGPAVSGVEVKIADDGELLAKGACVMKGYWNDEAATANTVKDGWLYTGDIAEISDDGYISITGRKKDIIVNSGGDNIAPSRVEAMLTIEPEIEQAMVDGDKRPWLVAVLVPSDELAKQFASDKKGLTQAVQNAVDRANSRLSQIEKVRRFILADEPFGTENGQMTPTLKAKRHVIREVYEDKLLSLYPKK
ncbi:MAG: AMP-dependent synthetase/ligase [Candidatus Puniceispirillaceae bacterium]